MQDFWSEFSAVDTAEWQRSVERVLRGVSASSLDWQVDADLQLRPMYRASETGAASSLTAGALYVPFLSEAWRLEGDAAALNTQIKSALAQGVTELILVLPADWQQADLILALEGVWLDMLRVSFELEREADGDKLRDFLRGYPCTGHLKIGGGVAEAFAWAEEFPAHSAYTVCCGLGSEDTEAAVLAKAVESMQAWLQYTLSRGWSWEQAINAMRVEIEIGDHYLIQIARVRALRRLYLALAESWQAAGQYMPTLLPALPILARSSSRDNLHKISTFSLLAATNQALSASIGGVQALQITPAIGWESIDEPTARRLARNVYHVLQNESYLFAVLDPAAGAYYIENATEQLASRAWAIAQC